MNTPAKCVPIPGSDNCHVIHTCQCGNDDVSAEGDIC